MIENKLTDFGVMMDSFEHHTPNEFQVNRILDVRAACKNAASVIWNSCPPSADRTAALRKLHEAMMTANKSIVLGGQ